VHLRDRRLGIRPKVFIGVIGPLAVVFLFFTLASERYLAAQITARYQDHVEQGIDSLATGIRRHDEHDCPIGYTELLDDFRASGGDYEQIALFGSAAGGRALLAKSQSNAGTLKMEPFYELPLRTRKTVTRETPDWLEVASPVRLGGGEYGVLAVRTNLADRNALVAYIRNQGLYFAGIGFVSLSAVMLLGLGHTFLVPLRALREMTSSAGEPSLVSAPVHHRDDEIGDVARSIEAMAKRLKRRSQTLEQRVRELSLLHNTSKVTNSALTLDEALSAMLASAGKTTKATGGFIMLEDKGQKSGRLKLKATWGWSINKARRAVVSQDIARFVAGSGEPLLLTGESTDIGFEHRQEFGDAIFAPISLGEETIGVIALLNQENGGFTEKNLQLLLTLANQASGAINSARLFEDLQASYLSTIQALAAAIDAKDSYTRGHSGRVVKYSQRIAAQMGLSGDEIMAVKTAAYLHDIGKIGIDERILLKPGALTAVECQNIMRHPGISAKILARVAFLQEAIPVVRHHHERFDGGGYPDGLAGAEIPLGARILAVADSFDAMTSDRPYRRALDARQARLELKRSAGAQFDPLVVEAFLNDDRDRSGLPEDLTTVIDPEGADVRYKG
jgi:hypothetical protein